MRQGFVRKAEGVQSVAKRFLSTDEIEESFETILGNEKCAHEDRR